jgi:hypothetical protein
LGEIEKIGITGHDGEAVVLRIIPYGLAEVNRERPVSKT